MHLLLLEGGLICGINYYKNTSPRLCTKNAGEGCLGARVGGGGVFARHYGTSVMVYILASFVGMLVLEWPYACTCKVIMVN